MVERIIEKHSTFALMLCDKRLNISALRPRCDSLPLLTCNIDCHRLLFSGLPDSVSTDTFKKYLQRSSPSHDSPVTINRQSMITSVLYGRHRGVAMALFQQPYGKLIYVLLLCIILLQGCVRANLRKIVRSRRMNFLF